MVGKFLRQHENGEHLTIVPDGNQRRDFTYVKDVVDANVLAMLTEHSHYGEVFNVGTGKNYSVLELADMISDKKQFVESRIGEAKETLADNSKIKEVLNWHPKISLDVYIRNKLSKGVHIQPSCETLTNI